VRRSARRRRIVTASSDKTARLWEADTGKLIGEPLQGPCGSCVERGVQPKASASSPRPGQDGAAVGPETGMQIGEPLKGHEEAVSSAAFSPDGQRIVTRPGIRGAAVGPATGKQVGEPLNGHTSYVSSAAFSRRQAHRHCVLDKTARLWDRRHRQANRRSARGSRQLRVERGAQPDGRRNRHRLPGEGAARLWEAETRKPYREPLEIMEG